MKYIEVLAILTEQLLEDSWNSRTHSSRFGAKKFHSLFQPTIPADPSIVYHATVVAPETFVEEDDVNELKKHLGIRKGQIVFSHCRLLRRSPHS